jgi:hypothetical protein
MEVSADDGRIYLSKRLREKFGRRFELVDRGDRLVLIPLDEDPLEALREEFADVDKTVSELREAVEFVNKHDATFQSAVAVLEQTYTHVGDDREHSIYYKQS